MNRGRLLVDLALKGSRSREGELSNPNESIRTREELLPELPSLPSNEEYRFTTLTPLPRDEGSYDGPCCSKQLESSCSGNIEQPKLHSDDITELTASYNALVEPSQADALADVDSDFFPSDQDEPFPGSDSDSEYVPSKDDQDESLDNDRIEDEEGEKEEGDREVTGNAEGINREEDQEDRGPHENDISRQDGRRRKRKSKGQGESSGWKRKRNYLARLRGDAYEGFEKSRFDKYEQTAPREKRQLKPRCQGHQTAKKGPQQKFECVLISEEERGQIFESFWKLTSWESKKTYVSGLVEISQPKHRRRQTVVEESRKKLGFKYYLSLKSESETVRRLVCKNMFLATLGLGEKCVRAWTQGCRSVEASSDIEELPKLSECSKILVSFLEHLPKVESHYCRASTRKLYLEPIWNSYRQVHREFLNYCQAENKRSCSWRLFLKTFRSMNLEIYSPRKDQCNKCTMFKKGNIDKTDYDTHVLRKEEARNEKIQDKERAADASHGNKVNVYTMDLQAVLLCPHTQANAMYFKQKLKVHNLTYYNLNDREVSCYLWHEGNGGLESDIFVSIMIRFLEAEIDLHNPSLIVIWSDGCCYQNRNVNMANGLLELATRKKIIIQQKYLEVGHTQMEVDSIHSVIERKLRRRTEVSVPADYINIIRSARQNPSPYKVISLKYDDFMEYKQGPYTSIRPGSKKGDPCVTDICALQYQPGGIIEYKLHFSDPWNEIVRRSSRQSHEINHAPLYSTPRSIDVTKFVHLQELKSVLEPDYHEFYNNLKHDNCTSRENCQHIKLFTRKQTKQ